MKSLIVSLGLHKGSGGPVKTIGSFRYALDAKQICFYPKSEIVRRPLAVGDAEVVCTSEFPMLKQFRYAHSTEQAQLICRDTGIISCHSLYRYHTVWVNRMHRKVGVPYWFVPHGVLDPWVMEYGRIPKQLFWKFAGDQFLREASTVIFATRSERDKACAQFDLPGAEVIPWPVESINIAEKESKRKQVREQLGISEDAKVLVYFGRLHEMKRPLETIQAVGASKRGELHLIVVGNEQNVTLADCRKAAEEAGVQNRVHLVGPVYGEKKFDYLFAADAYISLSWRENFNHTAAESLSAGLPVILSPGNDLQSEINAQECSWGLPDNEPETASDAIEAFCATDLGELAAMGERGRAWVARCLSFEAFSERINAVARQYARI